MRPPPPPALSPSAQPGTRSSSHPDQPPPKTPNPRYIRAACAEIRNATRAARTKRDEFYETLLNGLLPELSSAMPPTRHVPVRGGVRGGAARSGAGRGRAGDLTHGDGAGRHHGRAAETEAAGEMMEGMVGHPGSTYDDFFSDLGLFGRPQSNSRERLRSRGGRAAGAEAGRRRGGDRGAPSWGDRAPNARTGRRRRSGSEHSDTSAEDDEYYLSDDSVDSLGEVAPGSGSTEWAPPPFVTIDPENMDEASARRIAALCGSTDGGQSLVDAVNAARIGGTGGVARDGGAPGASDDRLVPALGRGLGQFESPRRQAPPFGADMSPGRAGGRGGYREGDEWMISDAESDAERGSNNSGDDYAESGVIMGTTRDDPLRLNALRSRRPAGTGSDAHPPAAADTHAEPRWASGPTGSPGYGAGEGPRLGPELGPGTGLGTGPAAGPAAGPQPWQEDELLSSMCVGRAKPPPQHPLAHPAAAIEAATGRCLASPSIVFIARAPLKLPPGLTGTKWILWR